MQPGPLTPERCGRGDQVHPEQPRCEATLALPRTRYRTVAQMRPGASRETYLTALTPSPRLDSLKIGHRLPHPTPFLWRKILEWLWPLSSYRA